MRKPSVLLLAVSLLVGVMAIPASAGVEKNPNTSEGTSSTCSNGLTSDIIIQIGQTGHDPDEGFTGVATSAYILSGPGGAVLATLFARPGKGLHENTTWCEWMQDGLWLGADILLRGNLR